MKAATGVLLFCNLIIFTQPAPDPDVHLHLHQQPPAQQGAQQVDRFPAPLPLGSGAGVQWS